MTAPPTPRTFQAGEIETAAYMNSLASVVNFLLNPPRCRVYATASQSLGNSAYTVLTFGGEVWDTDNMHSTVTNTSRITANTSGLYQVQALATANANATGRRLGALQKNGVVLTTDSIYTLGGQSGTYGATVFINEEIQLAAGDYVEFAYFQDSGAALGTVSTSNTNSWFSARWVAAS